MASTTAMCTSFKAEILQAVHNFTITTGHVFKVALYTSTATNGAATTAYSATNEISGTAYVAGGFAFTAAQNITPLTSGTGAYTSWSTNPTWAAASFTAASCLFYNSSASNKAVAVFDFGGNQTVTSGTFTINLPTNGVGTSVIQIN